MSALFQSCKAFLFPSLMEGFGIPPLEALYYNVPIIISDTSSLPEIYEDCAHYIDPFKYDYCLDRNMNAALANNFGLFPRCFNCICCLSPCADGKKNSAAGCFSLCRFCLAGAGGGLYR